MHQKEDRLKLEILELCNGKELWLKPGLELDLYDVIHGWIQQYEERGDTLMAKKLRAFCEEWQRTRGKGNIRAMGM